MQISQSSLPFSLADPKSLELITARDSTNEYLLLRYNSITLIKSFLIFQDFAALEKALGRSPLTQKEFIKRLINSFNFPQNRIFFIVSGLVQLYNTISLQKGFKSPVTFNGLLDLVLEVSRPLKEKTHSLCAHRLPVGDKGMMWPKGELPFVSPVIHEVKNPPFMSILLDSLKTNAKTFKTPVKFCLFSEQKNIFILTLEGIFKVYIFDSNASLLTEIEPKNEEKSALNVLAVDYSDLESKVISSACDFGQR